jgi:DNA-binding transcriptional LysR family regulator
VVRRGHPLDRGRDATLAEVVRHRVALPTRMPPRILEPLLRHREGGQAASTQISALTCPDLAVTLRLVRKLDLVTAVPLALVRKEIAEGSLVVIGHEPWMKTQYGIAWPRKARTPAAAAFAEVLTQVDARFPDEAPPERGTPRRKTR